MNDTVITILASIIPAFLISLYIYRLTLLNSKLSGMEKWSTDISKIINCINANKFVLNTLGSVDWKHYQRYFSSIIDRSNEDTPVFDNWHDFKGDFIYFDSFISLPVISDYMLLKLDEYITENKEMIMDSFVRMNEARKEEKYDFVIDTKAILVSYDFINVRIQKLNHTLDYYRDMTKAISNLNIKDNTEHLKVKTTILLFDFAISSINAQVTGLKDFFGLLENTVIKAKKDINQEIDEVKKDIVKNNGFFAALLIMTAIILIA